jgi:hypothetical protein
LRFLGRAAGIDLSGQQVIIEAASEILRQRSPTGGPARATDGARLSSHQAWQESPGVLSPEQDFGAEL